MKKLLLISCALVSGLVFTDSYAGTYATQIAQAIQENSIQGLIDIGEKYQWIGAENAHNLIANAFRLITEKLDANGKGKQEGKKGSLGLSLQELETLNNQLASLKAIIKKWIPESDVRMNFYNTNLSRLQELVLQRLDVARLLSTSVPAAAASSEEPKKAKKA